MDGPWVRVSKTTHLPPYLLAPRGPPAVALPGSIRVPSPERQGGSVGWCLDFFSVGVFGAKISEVGLVLHFHTRKKKYLNIR